MSKKEPTKISSKKEEEDPWGDVGTSKTPTQVKKILKKPEEGEEILQKLKPKTPKRAVEGIVFEDIARSVKKKRDKKDEPGTVVLIVGETGTRKTTLALSGEGIRYYIGTEYGADEFEGSGLIPEAEYYNIEILDVSNKGYEEKFGKEDTMGISRQGFVKYEAEIIMKKISKVVATITNSLRKIYSQPEKDWPKIKPRVIIDTWDDIWMFAQQFREEYYAGQDAADGIKAGFEGWDGPSAWAKVKSIVWSIYDSFKKFPIDIVLICRGYPELSSEGVFIDYKFSVIKNTDFRSSIILYTFPYFKEGLHPTSAKIVIRKVRPDAKDPKKSLTRREYINPTFRQIRDDIDRIKQLNKELDK